MEFVASTLKVAQLLRIAACLHTNQSRSYLNHLVKPNTSTLSSVPSQFIVCRAALRNAEVF